MTVFLCFLSMTFLPARKPRTHSLTHRSLLFHTARLDRSLSVMIWGVASGAGASTLLVRVLRWIGLVKGRWRFPLHRRLPWSSDHPRLGLSCCPNCPSLIMDHVCVHTSSSMFFKFCLGIFSSFPFSTDLGVSCPSPFMWTHIYIHTTWQDFFFWNCDFIDFQFRWRIDIGIGSSDLPYILFKNKVNLIFTEKLKI